MKFKKIICSALIAAGIFSSFATTAFAADANTEDRKISIVWSYSTSSFQFIKENGKEGIQTSSDYDWKGNSSKVFFKYTSASGGNIDVQTRAISASGVARGDSFLYSETTNYTYNPSTGKIVNFARCTPGKNYGISSLIYEKGEKYTDGKKYATLMVKSSAINYGTGEGWWSPDSSQTHNTPTYLNS